MLLGSYKSRERKLEHQLTAEQVEAAQSRRDRFVKACKSNHCPLSTATVHRSYVEALEEVLRGDGEEAIPDDATRYERRRYDSQWQMMDWPT